MEAGEPSVAMVPIRAVYSLEPNGTQRYANPMNVSTGQMIDLHCHCLPGLDDGPKDMREALDICAMLIADNIHTVLATPHFLGPYDGAYTMAEIAEQARHLQEVLAQRSMPLRVVPGAEIRVDERIVSMIQEDRIVPIAGNRPYLILELPFDSFIDLGVLLHSLFQMGIRVMIAHPERHSILAAKPDLIQPWSRFEPILQICAGSLVGSFGRAANRAAWHLLATWPNNAVVISDAHNIHTRPSYMQQAFQLICQTMGSGIAWRSCCEKPAEILSVEMYKA